MKLLAVASVLLMTACPKSAAAPVDAGPQVIFGGNRPMRLSAPHAYSGWPTPLLLALHGYGNSGKPHEEYLGLDKLVDGKGVLLVSPEGTVDKAGHRFWNAGSDACCNFGGDPVDDVKYLRELIAEIRRVYSVDPRRIYVLGHSNGGFMAYRLACELSGEIAAVVSLAGSSDVESCELKKPVSVLQIHGDGDVGVRYDGGTNILGKGGGDYPGALESAARWAKANRCLPTLTAGAPVDLDSKLPGPETTVATYDGCPKGVEVAVWTIQEGSHVPEVTAAFPSLVWKWLEAHPK